MTVPVQNIQVKSYDPSLDSLDVRNVGPEHREQWDDYVEKHPHSTMYHLFGWKRVFEKTFGYPSYYLAAFNEKRDMVGILPMFLMRDIARKKYLVSNPFSNFAGLCSDGDLVGSAILQKAFSIARQQNAQYIEFRQLAYPLNGELTDEPLPAKESFVTLMLDMTAGSEAIWSSLSSRNRGKVRKAQKNGLTTDLGKHYLEDFHRILAVNLKYLGTPVHPASLYREIIEVFQERIDILAVKSQSEVAAAMFLFKFKDVLSEPWVASLRQYNRIYVNNMLYWNAIEYGCQNDFKTFDFGRSTVNTGTYDFKVQWGAEPVPLYYHYFLHRARTIPVVDAVNNEYEKYIEIWKKLPLNLTKLIGPRLVKYVPQL